MSERQSDGNWDRFRNHLRDLLQVNHESGRALQVTVEVGVRLGDTPSLRNCPRTLVTDSRVETRVMIRSVKPISASPAGTKHPAGRKDDVCTLSLGPSLDWGADRYAPCK